jgi:uncharacterized protein (TIGR02391 family)
MILSDDEMKTIRQAIDERSGLDEELLNRCTDFLRTGKYDEAVRNAFILLEERLRVVVNKEGMTGTQLANYAFSPANGPLAKLLGNNDAEKEGLRELFSGAFKLFRNPTAHGVVGYDRVEGKSIIGLVNLLLKIVNRVGELPPPSTFPENLENSLSDIEKVVGAAATSRLRKFLGRCIVSGIKPTVASKHWQWIPFKRYALLKYDHWDKPKVYQLTLFYLVVNEKDKSLWFPVNQYYSNAVDFDLDPIKRELRSIGFQLTGKYQDYRADLKIHNSANFFDQLFDILIQTSKELETRLEQA